MAAQLAPHVPPDSRLWVAGDFGGGIYLALEARPATPYIYTQAAAETAVDAGVVIDALKRSHAPIRLGPFWSEGGEPGAMMPPPIHAFLRANYRPVAEAKGPLPGHTYFLWLWRP